LSVTAIGLILWFILYYFEIRPVYLKFQMLQQEETALNTNLKRYQKYTSVTYSLPTGLTNYELNQLGKQVPVGENHPEFMVQLEQDVKSAGATPVNLELIDDLSEAVQVQKNGTEVKTAHSYGTGQFAKELGLVQSPNLKPIWIKLEVKATKSQFTNLLQKLYDNERLVSVVSWDYRYTDKTKPAAGTIYAGVYYYTGKVKSQDQPE
jgi:hypothetical protein